jgi:hypothetical protein
MRKFCCTAVILCLYIIAGILMNITAVSILATNIPIEIS